ncbi:MAG: ATP-binding protein [Sulfolobales archaeon]
MPYEILTMDVVMKRIRLEFVRGLEIEFIDRDRGVKQILDLAERGTRFPLVVFGPEGCGKSAWMRQASEIFREFGFDVIYINPIERRIIAEVGVEDVRKKLLEIIGEATPDPWARAVYALIMLAQTLLKAGRRRLAILVDEAFHVIGTGREAAIYVKGLLGLIEYPPRSYDVIVAVVATSEGVSRREIGRHRWGDLMPMWNMPKEGFKQLYDQLPGDKPGFEEIWRLAGGNPRILAQLYEERWNIGKLVGELIRERDIRGFMMSLSEDERKLLARAIEDPDALMCREGISLIDRLVKLNLVVDNMYERDPWFWIDAPPPEKDPELGIGKEIAWQTPLHREAVKRALSPTFSPP